MTLGPLEVEKDLEEKVTIKFTDTETGETNNYSFTVKFQTSETKKRKEFEEMLKNHIEESSSTDFAWE
jgi:sorbitol-specific phosphotransferase system component IIA